MDVRIGKLYDTWQFFWHRVSWQMLLALDAGLFLWRNLLLPLVGDDYSYAFIWNGDDAGNLIDGIGPRQKIASLSDILISQWSHYFTWGGRVPALSCVQFFAWQGGGQRLLFDFVNTFVFVLLTLLIFWLAAGKIETPGKCKSALFWLMLGLFFALPSYLYTMIWMTGACVYLWTATASCAFLLPYSLSYWKKSFWQKAAPWHVPLMTLLGLLAGWSVEPCSIVTMLLALSFILFFHRERRLQKWQTAGFFGLLAGLTLLFAAPGNFMRVEIMQQLASDYTLPKELLWTPSMFLYNFLEGFWPIFKSEVPLLVPIVLYFWKGKHTLASTRYILLFTIGSFLVLCAMMFSPDFRAHAGYHSVIFLLVASSAAFRAILPSAAAWCAASAKLRLGAAILAWLSLGSWVIAAMLCLIIETSYSQQWSERERIIAEHRQDDPIVVPAIELPWNLDKVTGARSVTKILLLFGADLESNPTDNRSNIFAQYYGLKGIVIDKEINWEAYGEENEW